MNKYQKYFSKQVVQREKVYQKLLRVAVERSTVRPSSGAWCASEIMQHLNISEGGVLHVLSKQLSKDPSAFRSHELRGKWRSILLNLSLLSNFKFKAPSVVADAGEIEPPADLYAKWTTFQRGMMELLGNIPPGMENKLVFRHPVAGWLSLKETLQFMRFHQMHHMRQVIHRAGLL